MKKKKLKKLLFVYNADSGRRNAILDGMHKVFSPSTYQCSLCDITFGVISENKAWKAFRHKSPFKMDFLHKDEFVAKYGSVLENKPTFPMALTVADDNLNVFISTEEMDQLKTAGELIVLIKERV